MITQDDSNSVISHRKTWMAPISRLLMLACLMLSLTSCFTSQLYSPKRPYVRDFDSDAFTEVSLFQANSVAHKWRWYLEDAWMTYDDTDTVHHIRMQYRTQNILELQEARARLVDFVEDFMDRLEANGEAFGHLNPDFSVDNLTIYVDFQTYWGKMGDPQYIGWMVLEDGLVYYYDFDVKNRDTDYWYSRIESFNKSAEVVRIEREAENSYQINLPPTPKSHLNEARVNASTTTTTPAAAQTSSPLGFKAAPN